MKRIQLLLALGLVAPAGCAAHATGTVMTSGSEVYVEPPEPQEEKQVTERPGYFWIHGRWEWGANQWSWLNGHWEKERDGQGWDPGHWDKHGNAWHWTEGRWVPREGGPPEHHAPERHAPPPHDGSDAPGPDDSGRD